MSSAAVLTVYAAGYVRTRPAANRVAYDKFIEQAAPQQASREADVPPPAPARQSASSPAPAVPDRAEAKKPPAVASTAAPSVVKETASVPGPVAQTAMAAAAVASPAETPASTAQTQQAAEVASVSTAASAHATTAPASPASTEPPAAAAATAPTAPPAPVWKDGKYSAWGTCQHGDIEATVVIEGGKIVSADISNCQTRYSCDVIENLPAKVVTRQKAKFDRVGGATESAYAYYGAVYWALDKASK